MYQVTLHHYYIDPADSNKEGKLELIRSINFYTRREAKKYIEDILKKYIHEHIVRNYRKGDTPSYCLVFTGMTWQHKYTKEIIQEYYQFTLSKEKKKKCNK